MVADLASANGTSVNAALRDSGIGYILLPETKSVAARSLAIALDGSDELEPVGLTDYGRLWRVAHPNETLSIAPESTPSPWSITKAVQLSVLLGFLLLAIPSTNQRRRVSGDSQIFVEAGEEN